MAVTKVNTSLIVQKSTAFDGMMEEDWKIVSRRQYCIDDSEQLNTKQGHLCTTSHCLNGTRDNDVFAVTQRWSGTYLPHTAGLCQVKHLSGRKISSNQYIFVFVLCISRIFTHRH